MFDSKSINNELLDDFRNTFIFGIIETALLNMENSKMSVKNRQ